MHILAIDPGLHGALAWLPQEGRVEVYDMPSVEKRIHLAALYKLCDHIFAAYGSTAVYCYLERAQVYAPVIKQRQQGSVSSFNYGINYGLLLSVPVHYGFACVEVTAAAWKKRLGLSSDKEACRARAISLFPHCELHLKRHHDRAEALLLAWYGRQQLLPHRT